MRVGADKKGLITVGGRDPRITYSGYFIRKYKLDELPQLLNVLNNEGKETLKMFVSQINITSLLQNFSDSSVEDIFTPLISGSKLVLIDQSNSSFDVNLIRKLIVEQGANNMLVVPTPVPQY